MKKLLIAATMLFATAGVFAQTQPKKDAKEKAPKMVVVKKADSKKETAKVVPMPKPATTVAPVKKDGSADMRFKVNKEAAKPTVAGPTKKDGTADMRYKANKKDAGKKKKG
jgi:hypothetical protein